MNEEEYEKLKKRVEIKEKEFNKLGTDIDNSCYSINFCVKRKEYSEGIKECKKIIKNFNKLLENKEIHKTNIDVLSKEKKIRELSIKKHLDKTYDSNQVFDLNSGIFEKYVDEHFGYYTNFGIEHEDVYTNMCEIYINTKSDVLISMEWDNHKTVKHNFKRFFESCEQIEKETKESKFRISKIEIKNEVLK